MPDGINGLFELCGGLIIALSIRRVLIDKCVRGLSVWHVAFFAAWGYWNLFYYPHLDQWLSFVGGLVVVAGNSVWVVLLVWYWRHPKPRLVGDKKGG